MSMKYIRKTYLVPAKRGMRVIANGEPGKIIGAHAGYLKVKLDMRKSPGIYHPTWHMVYLTENGEETFIGNVKQKQ